MSVVPFMTSQAVTAPAQRRRRTPSLEQLQWLKTALEVFVLLLAVPWLVHELLLHPGKLTQRVAGHHMK